MNSLSSYQRCGIRLSWIKFRMTNQVQDDDGSSPGWQIPRASLERGCVHHSLFIIHYALRNAVRRKPIMHYELWIMNCELCIVHYALWNEVRRKPIMHYKALYNVRACVCVWGVLNHLNPFYGEKRRFTVKKQCFTAGKRRFSMRKAAVLISNITNVAEYDCPESSSGWRVKHGIENRRKAMTISNCLDWKRVYSLFIRVFLIPNSR